MLLVVGLGNPGREYERTRHNVGFDVIDRLASRGSFGAWRKAESALVCRGVMGSTEVLLVKPMTYMNLSGQAVGGLMRFYKVSLSDLVVIHDELDFEPGVVRIKSGGGHGGHNGLRSIEAHVGSREFVRIRVGIGKPRSAADGANHVLSTFGKEERVLIDQAVDLALQAVGTIVEKGALAAMNQLNRRAEASGVKE